MSREDGYKNLVPMDQRSKDEARSLGQQGGIASGAARRRKRSMREAADYYLSLPETDRRRVNAMLRDAIDPEDIDNQMAVVMGVTERAKRGDPQAASVLLKMLGEDTVQEDPAADALALSRSGSSPSWNWMSSTGPMTWITLPMCFSDIGYNSFLKNQ